jgi:hypothetical protein
VQGKGRERDVKVRLKKLLKQAPNYSMFSFSSPLSFLRSQFSRLDVHVFDAASYKVKL